MSLGTIILINAVVITGVIILLVKMAPAWMVPLRNMTVLGRVATLVGFFAVAVIGGVKPGPGGPTKANLRILLAERKARSDGQPYGKKATLTTAAGLARDAGASVSNAAGAVASAGMTITNADAAADGVSVGPRYYIRLISPSPVVTNNTLYGEILTIDVTNGVAAAAVWFNVLPNSEPIMRFHFASDAATNLWFSARPTHSTFPDLAAVKGRQCYRYYFDVPPILLDGSGNLIAPLHWEPRIAFGSPETGEPFDLRGGLAMVADGRYYIAVTGWRTNAVDGAVYYYDNGRLAAPPNKTQEDSNNESM